jgi:hypothetical protein
MSCRNKGNVIFFGNRWDLLGQLDNFIKHSHSFAMTIFHKITKSAKLVILLIIPTYAKVSINTFCFSGLGWFIYVKLTVRT